MDPDATAKVVLITGASSGIGKEAARTLKKAGSVVYAAARRSEMMKDLENDGIRVSEPWLERVDRPSIELAAHQRNDGFGSGPYRNSCLRPWRRAPGRAAALKPAPAKRRAPSRTMRAPHARPPHPSSQHS